ncbi:bZIP transcription factor [Aspergillus brunneoviolaceus CBS 621.78]|uniref:Uncharacterized protein n=1 Tax=Aspergillus brunneoviolaceus CBS 621.78 TaxID=1450534 RepID=A0ACD1G056_9EURO|nr:hypothetical protein BO95DRAFT_455778 [Aspergillus brunneoviolaceus CBS 621.78]RAH42541.1 hypothetical protein BO95DRAFT_455778 [Aspergillus brunneoviolaceus CBS 621.78]
MNAESGIKRRHHVRHATTADAPEDDLLGVTDPVLRRRVQNRLNQRAYRQRQKPRSTEDRLPSNRKTIRAAAGDDQSRVQTLPHRSSDHNSIFYNLPEVDPTRYTYAPPNFHTLMVEFEKRARAAHAMGSPRTDLLLSLSRLNVIRAAYQNAVIAGMTVDWMCRDDAVSIFSMSGPHSPQYTLSAIPERLRPTPVQRTVPHHPWLDIFPFEQMRDNLIRAGDLLDGHGFCHDLTAFWDTRSSSATLLVWGDPWDPSNWEVTEEFARKWGYFLRGCPDILVSTNKWRAQRDEKPLAWRRVFGDYLG